MKTSTSAGHHRRRPAPRHSYAATPLGSPAVDVPPVMGLFCRVRCFLARLVTR